VAGGRRLATCTGNPFQLQRLWPSRRNLESEVNCVAVTCEPGPRHHAIHSVAGYTSLATDSESAAAVLRAVRHCNSRRQSRISDEQGYVRLQSLAAARPPNSSSKNGVTLLPRIPASSAACKARATSDSIAARGRALSAVGGFTMTTPARNPCPKQPRSH